MTPKFSEAVDNIFLHVLRLLDRIDRGEMPSAQDEQQHICGWIDQADALLGQSPDWQLAKYALVAWADEVLIDAEWDGRHWWRENNMEQRIFHTMLACDQFYLNAKEAATLPKKDALEVFYVCVVLGFRGLYRDPTEAINSSQLHDLPADLETWARQTSVAIKLGQGLPPIFDRGVAPAGAPALEGKAFFVSWLLVGVILAGVNLVLLVTLFSVK